VIGIAMYLAIVAVERLVIPWHASMRGGERRRRSNTWVTQIPALAATASFAFAACSGGGASTAPSSAATAAAPALPQAPRQRGR
jgi:hypothetical protein